MWGGLGEGVVCGPGRVVPQALWAFEHSCVCVSPLPLSLAGSMTDLPTIEVSVEGHEPSDLERAIRTLPDHVLSNPRYMWKMNDLMKAMVNLHPVDERTGRFTPLFENRCAYPLSRGVGSAWLPTGFDAHAVQALPFNDCVLCRFFLPNASTPEIAIVVRVHAPTSEHGHRPSAGFIGAVVVTTGVSRPFITATLGTSDVEVQALVDSGCSADVVWPQVGVLNVSDRHAFRDTVFVDSREYTLVDGTRVMKDVYR